MSELGKKTTTKETQIKIPSSMQGRVVSDAVIQQGRNVAAAEFYVTTNNKKYFGPVHMDANGRPRSGPSATNKKSLVLKKRQ